MTSRKLSSYLTRIGTFTAVAAGADAAVVSLDVSGIDGVNAGLSSGTRSTVLLSTLHPSLTGDFVLEANYMAATILKTGLRGSNGTETANLGTTVSPKNFAAGSMIDATATFGSSPGNNLFSFNGTESPDFGPGSYLGFKSANGHYGWLEVTWDGTSNEFQIYSGAFEDVAGVGIAAGPAAVPEPASLMGLGVLLMGGATLRSRRSPRVA